MLDSAPYVSKSAWSSWKWNWLDYLTPLYSFPSTKRKPAKLCLVNQSFIQNLELISIPQIVILLFSHLDLVFIPQFNIKNLSLLWVESEL